MTSDVALAFGRSMLQRFAVDWAAVGITGQRLDRLTEHMLRVLQSFVIDPGRPPRRGAELRDYLREWVGPAISYHHTGLSVVADGRSKQPRGKRNARTASARR